LMDKYDSMDYRMNYIEGNVTEQMEREQ